MPTLQLVSYALASALAAAFAVLLFGAAAFGFWLPAWTAQQGAALGIAATVAGIVAANAFLTRLLRCDHRRLSQ
jgi:hypothetical protein